MMPVLCATMPTRTSIGINVGRISVVSQGSMNLLIFLNPWMFDVFFDRVGLHFFSTDLVARNPNEQRAPKEQSRQARDWMNPPEMP